MLDNRIDVRLKRAWELFLASPGELLLGGGVVILGLLLIVPGPWFALNFLQEVLECARTGRRVRWQASFDRTGNFLRSWGLAFALGVPLVVAFALCIVPGVLLSLFWFFAPVLVADGRRVFDSLGESYRVFMRRKDWATYFLNWLVLALLSSLGGITAIAVLLTLPLSLVYLVLCYLDETAEPSAESPETHLPA